MSLQQNLPPWLPLSFILAQHLIKHKLHKRVLTLVERKYFEDATCSFATWIAFIQQHDNTLIELDTTAFRVRSMLYEQFIPHLFHTHRSCCKLLDLEPLIAQARQLTMPTPQDITREWEAFVETHVKKQAALHLHNTTTTTTTIPDEPKHEGEELPQGLHTPTHNLNKRTLLNHFLVAETLTPTPVINKPTEEPTIVTDNVPLRDIYQTLESDRAAMTEQRKLEVKIVRSEISTRSNIAHVI